MVNLSRIPARKVLFGDESGVSVVAGERRPEAPVEMGLSLVWSNLLSNVKVQNDQRCTPY
jgi:hypothetical protein